MQLFSPSTRSDVSESIMKSCSVFVDADMIYADLSRYVQLLENIP